MTQIINYIKNNIVAQFIIVLVVGIVIGAIFYPTKHIEERMNKMWQKRVDTVREWGENIGKKHLDDHRKEVKAHNETKIEMTKKISKLEMKVTELNAKKKETFYKIVKPDGTIEIKKYKESEVNETTKVVTKIREEFDQKIKSIASKWQAVHKKRISILKKEYSEKEAKYQAEIKQLKSEKIVDINPKSFGLEVGYLHNKNWYSHTSYDLFGPVFIGIHTESDFKDDFVVGGGIGVRF